jgi:ABC-type uncharacterized transport system substrate-binding protein
MTTMLTRRQFITATLFAAAWPLKSVFAQSPAGRKIPRIAYVWLFDTGPSAPYTDVFRKRLEELGWVEGKTIVAEYRGAKGSQEELAKIMTELVRMKVDLIVAMCTPEAIAAKKVTSTIPIVVTAIGDPVMAGLATSLGRPGGNVTGVSAVMLPLSAKRVELLKDVFPNIKRATVIWNPVRPDNEQEVKIMQQAGRQIGIDVQSIPVHSPEDVAFALDVIETDGTQAILNTGDTLLTLESPTIVKRAAELRIPAIYESRVFVDAGGLMSYGPIFPELHRRAAEVVDKVLRGANPGDLPFEQPSRFELIINKTAANALGIKIPPAVLVRADEVIE